MPYVSEGRRESLQVRYVGYDGQPSNDFPDTAGDLNYVVTQVINDYLNGGEPKITYSRINEVIGVLECAKLELYRRLAVPYEAKKLDQNGEVYLTREQRVAAFPNGPKKAASEGDQFIGLSTDEVFALSESGRLVGADRNSPEGV